MSYDWLPDKILLADYGGDWTSYEAAVYEAFRADFVSSKPGWPLQRVGLKRQPLSGGKEATYWHFISSGKDEANREIDIRRCESIRWPKAMMEEFAGRKPCAGDRIAWWKTERGAEMRYVLSTLDFGYVVVVAEREDFVLPWTQYFVGEDHTRRKLKRQFEEYWAKNG